MPISSGAISSAGARPICRGPMAEPDLVLDHARLARVRHGATAVMNEPAVFRISGPGALGCLQGMLTNDLEKPGDDSLVYGEHS